MSNFDLLEGLEASYTLPSLSADGPSSAGISDYDREPLMLSMEIEGSQAGEVRDQLLAAIELAQAMEWRDIATLPNWEDALLTSEHGNGVHAEPVDDCVWSIGDCELSFFEIVECYTHWMPLPPVQEGE